MANKPPAFQFYAKDWRSSMNVQRMTHEQRGIFIDMMAIAWDSDDPGTIALSDAALCRELRIFSRTLRRLLADFPATWLRVGGKLVQPKLREQWLKYQEIQQKRSSALLVHQVVKGVSASASASAPASAEIKSRALIARDRRITKEAETKKELAVGTLPFPSNGAKGGNVRKDYIEFLDLRNTGRISRDVNWSKWEPLSEAERRQLLEMPGPVTVGHLEELEKQKA